MITATEFRTLDKKDKMSLIDEMSEKEARTLFYDWSFWARPSQLEPIDLGKDGKFIWLFLAGRGFGKSRLMAEWFVEKIKNHNYKYTTLVGATADDVRNIQIEGESGLLNICPPWFYPNYQPSKKKLYWPNGAVTSIFYGSEPDVPRGKQSDLVWCDELAKWKYPEETLDNILFGLRLGESPLCGITTTPRPIKIIKDLVSRDDCITVKGNSYENKENLSDVFINTIIRKYEGTRLGRQEIYAALLDDNPDALWIRKDLDDYRVEKAPKLYKIIVAVDPEASVSEESSETGIIIIGEGNALSGMNYPDLPHYYVLDDLTIKASPEKWGRQVVTGYYKYQCDRIIAEKNNGGDMVKSTIHNVDANVPVSLVWASRGKYTRAEPISVLSEQGRIHHVGSFPILEDQQCEWCPGEKSPDRLDAFVWGASWLSGTSQKPSTPITKQRREKTRSKVVDLPT